MNSPIDESEWPEVRDWLREMWGDDEFALFRRADLAGTYTRLCCIVSRAGTNYILKLYNLNGKGWRGSQTEMAHYEGYSHRHPLFPNLIATLPLTKRGRDLPEAILISYYPRSFEPGSLLELMACLLNLATIFTHFSRDGLIYFDLKVECLMLDFDGSLHLIDFTDLLKPDTLSIHRMGLPCPDYGYSPPEGQRYHQAYVKYMQEGSPYRSLIDAARELRPDQYHSFILARLALFLLHAREPSDDGFRHRLAAAGAPREGAFTPDEMAGLQRLFEGMLDQAPERRVPLESVRHHLWALIEPRLMSEEGALSHSALRARRLLRTMTEDASDPLSLSIHGRLKNYGGD